MSSRNLRKLVGNSLPPPESDSDGEYDPLGNRQTGKSTYEGLVVSSDSNSDEELSSELSDTEDVEIARKKSPQKKKFKGKKNNNVQNRGGDAGPSTSGGSQQQNGRNGFRRRGSRDSCGGPELDEIDQSLWEVNQLLGDPPPAFEPPEIIARTDPVLEIHARHLNVATELKKLFGPELPEDVRQRVKLQPHRARILKRVSVAPTHECRIFNFKKTGLSMNSYKKQNGVTYFAYDHDQDHRKMHTAFLTTYAKAFLHHDYSLVGIDVAKKTMHVERLLDFVDILFKMEQYGKANELVENMAIYLQYVAHPSFNLAGTNVRLLYTYIENRPFHVVMLKYLYLLTNKACHRTALEIAKMLLNIDPSDPLAVLFVIDILALRAREHKWLIEAIDYFTRKRQANLLFHMQYSYALAHFHVAYKTRSDYAAADKYLQDAILSYPQVVVKILEYSNVHEQRIQSHPLFASGTTSIKPETMDELIMIHTKLVYQRWREPRVLAWFTRNIVEVAENYTNSAAVRVRAKNLAEQRKLVFQRWPKEILRHISIIRPMSALILETELGNATRATSSWDPLFDRGINRYPPGDMRQFIVSHFFTIDPKTTLTVQPWQGVIVRAPDRPQQQLPIPFNERLIDYSDPPFRQIIIQDVAFGDSDNESLGDIFGEDAEEEPVPENDLPEDDLPEHDIPEHDIPEHDLSEDDDSEDEHLQRCTEQFSSIQDPSLSSGHGLLEGPEWSEQNYPENIELITDFPVEDHPSGPQHRREETIPTSRVYNLHELDMMFNPSFHGPLMDDDPNAPLDPMDFFNMYSQNIYDNDDEEDEYNDLFYPDEQDRVEYDQLD